jgi:hypothetical protein
MGGLFGGHAAPKPAKIEPVSAPAPVINENGAAAGNQSQQVTADQTPLNPNATTRSQFLGY